MGAAQKIIVIEEVVEKEAVKTLNARLIEEELGGLLYMGQFSCEKRAYNSGQWPEQRSQQPIFCPDICAKSESNPKCLSKYLDKTNPKKRVFATKPVSRQKRVFVQLQLGHVLIGMIPATPYFA